MSSPGLVQVGISQAEWRVVEGQLRAAMGKLKNVEKGVQKATATAINKTAKFVQGQMAKSIASEVNIKQRDIRPHIKIDRKATVLNGVAVVVLSKTKRLQLIYFGARDTGQGGWKNRTGSGVTYKISRKGPRKRIRNAFITTANGHRMVTKRLGPSRLPLAGPLRGPSPWGVYVISGMRKVTVEQGRERLRKELKEQVRYATYRASKSA